MGVKILRKETSLEMLGDDRCENKKWIECAFKLATQCTQSSTMKKLAIADCNGKSFTQITPAEFNASTGKKWRVKKDGRVVPYFGYSQFIESVMEKTWDILQNKKPDTTCKRVGQCDHDGSGCNEIYNCGEYEN